MGVNIYATNSNYKFGLSYSGFNRIRRVIADRLDSDFGDLYYEWTKVPNTFSKLPYKDRVEKSVEYLNKMEHLVNNKNLDQDVVNFLMLPDIKGSVTYKTCRKLAAALFGEIEESYLIDWNQFKEFLMECYSHRRNMCWS